MGASNAEFAAGHGGGKKPSIAARITGERPSSRTSRTPMRPGGGARPYNPDAHPSPKDRRDLLDATATPGKTANSVAGMIPQSGEATAGAKVAVGRKLEADKKRNARKRQARTNKQTQERNNAARTVLPPSTPEEAAARNAKVARRDEYATRLIGQLRNHPAIAQAGYNPDLVPSHVGDLATAVDKYLPPVNKFSPSATSYLDKKGVDHHAAKVAALADFTLKGSGKDVTLHSGDGYELGSATRNAQNNDAPVDEKNVVASPDADPNKGVAIPRKDGTSTLNPDTVKAPVGNAATASIFAGTPSDTPSNTGGVQPRASSRTPPPPTAAPTRHKNRNRKKR